MDFTNIYILIELMMFSCIRLVRPLKLEYLGYIEETALKWGTFYIVLFYIHIFLFLKVTQNGF